MDIDKDGVDEFSIWNITHVLNHVSENMVSFILLICVFFIIYLVDRLCNYNTMIMSMAATSAPVTIIPSILKKRKHKRV
jgi:hypothetical protein